MSMILEAFSLSSNPHIHEKPQLVRVIHLDEIAMTGPSTSPFWISPGKFINAWLGHIPFELLNLKQEVFRVFGSELHIMFGIWNLFQPGFDMQRLTAFMIHLVPLPPRIQTAIYLVLFYYKWNIIYLIGTKQYMTSQIQDRIWNSHSFELQPSLLCLQPLLICSTGIHFS